MPISFPPDPSSSQEKSFGPWLKLAEAIVNRILDEETQTRNQEEAVRAARDGIKLNAKAIKREIRRRLEDYLRNAASPVLYAIEGAQLDAETALQEKLFLQEITGEDEPLDCRVKCRRWIASGEVEKLIAKRKTEEAERREIPVGQRTPADETSRFVTRVLEELLIEVRRFCPPAPGASQGI